MLQDAVHSLGNIAIGNKDSRLKKYVKNIKALLTKVEYHTSDYYRDVYTESVDTQMDSIVADIELIIAESSDILDEALNAKQRMKMKQAFKKSAAKRKIGMKKSKKKLKDPEKLKKTANKKARDIIAKKIMKGKDKADMSFTQRASLEKKLNKKKGAIAKLAKKLKPKVKKADKERVKKARAGSK